MGEEIKCDVQAVIDAVERLSEPRPFYDEAGLAKLAVPRGMQLIDIQAEFDKRAESPRRAIGMVRANTLDAFIELTLRHASPDTVVYVDDGPQPSLVAVLNDHGGGAEPGWRDHRVVYSPTLSEEWKAWSSLHGHALSQVDFAQLLEDRCLDVVAPGSAGPKTQGIIAQLGVKAAAPAELQGLAKGLSIKVDQHVKEVRRLDSGEAQVIYSEQHSGEDGKPLSVPNAFIIAIPVFLGGCAYTLVVRLRYRARDGRITWSYNVVHADKAKRDAVLDMMATLREKFPDVLVAEGTP